MQKIIGSGSGGKGGGTTRIAQEESDTLQSISYAQVLDLVSEGEIEGLVNGLHSVYLDDTPMIDESGNPNFNGVQVDYRNGTQFQDPISGFPTSESETAVGIEVKKLTPVVRTITNTSVNAINVRVSIPQLTYQDPSNGDLKGSQVTFAIEVNSNGAGWVQKANDTIIGKCVSKYIKSYRIDLPSTGPHQVRVRRVTDDSTQSNLINKIYWESYGEVIDAKLRYPNSAMVAVRVDASNFKSIPKRSYELKLLKIKVPINYDPVLRKYTGFWDGTFKIAWSDNPAWVLYDLLTNTRYGASIDPNLIDKFGFYKIAKYCDEWVSDGFGTIEPRFTVNCYLQTRAEAYNLIKDLSTVFRGIVYWQGGSLTAIQDAPTDPAYLFTTSNVVNGSFSYQGTSKKNRYTVALVTWNDPADAYKPKVEYVEDPDAIAKYGVIQTEFVAFGCTSQGQAHRAGRWAIYASQYETEIVNFQTGLEAATIRLGQIVKIQDPMRAGSRLGGRVSNSAINSVTIDQDLTLDLVSNTYKLSVMLPNGNLEERQVLSYSARTLTVASNFSSIPHKQGVWMLAPSNVSPQLFRVISVGEEKGIYSISAIAYNPNKFSYVESGLKLSDRSITSLNIVPDDPTSLKITETLYQSGGEVKSKVTFSWAASLNAAYYKVSYKKTNGNLIELGDVKSNEVEIFNIDTGIFEFSVVASSSFGVESNRITTAYEVLGKAYPPGDVQGFSLVPQNDVAYLSWNPTSDLDVSIGGSVRIRFSPNPSGTWKDSVDVALLSGSSTRATVPLMNGTYFAKFVDSSGSASFNAASIKTSALEASKLNVIQTITESPTFPGTMTNMFYSSFYGGISIAAQSNIDDWLSGVDSILAWDYLGGVQSSGEYLFSNYIDLTNVYTSNVNALIDAASVDVADVIDMRTDAIDSWLDLDGVFIDDVNAELQLSTTEDDPASGLAVWTPWKRFFAAQYKARAFKFKLVATSKSQNHNIIIRNLAVTLDMPDREINLPGQTSSTGGTSIVYEKPFAVAPAIGITAYNMNAGDYHRITSASNAGFTITFFNSAGTGIVRSFDVLAKGYGRKVN